MWKLSKELFRGKVREKGEDPGRAAFSKTLEKLDGAILLPLANGRILAQRFKVALARKLLRN